MGRRAAIAERRSLSGRCKYSQHCHRGSGSVQRCGKSRRTKFRRGRAGTRGRLAYAWSKSSSSVRPTRHREYTYRRACRTDDATDWYQNCAPAIRGGGNRLGQSGHGRAGTSGYRQYAWVESEPRNTNGDAARQVVGGTGERGCAKAKERRRGHAASCRPHAEESNDWWGGCESRYSAHHT